MVKDREAWRATVHGVAKSGTQPSLCLCGVPENLNLSGLDLGSARNPEPAPCRATWSQSSVDWESTLAVSGGKPSVAQTFQTHPGVRRRLEGKQRPSLSSRVATGISWPRTEEPSWLQSIPASACQTGLPWFSGLWTQTLPFRSRWRRAFLSSYEPRFPDTGKSGS